MSVPPSSSTSCGCESTGLKKSPAWQGLTLASPLPGIRDGVVDSAEAAPEPESAQGEYNPSLPEAPLSIPLVEGQAAQHPVELLAPAGGLDAGYAAYHYGADAIYLGLQKFSARAEAENFTLDDVDAITTYAHSLEKRRRVFVTVNTLIFQNELRELIEALGAMADIGVDALIIQDLGVYRIVKKYFPELELHASTQLAVHNRAGAEALKALGFTRVVLARELTLEEVHDITATSGIETEVFIHGALCYSYSGLCLFSSQTLGRSGNRGRCAYSCRDDFQVSGAPETLRSGAPTKRDPNHGFAFSMKDLALPDHIPVLRAAGVSSLKIEGRKKSPLYVATTTDYYRKLIDGSLPEAERAAHEADMKAVFSRPWTRLFVQSHKDKEVADRDTVGHRGTPIGKVEAVLNAGSEMPVLRFTTARGIERHDGLQIDIPELGKPFGFAVEDLRVAGKKQRETVFEAPAGATVEVAMPEEHPPIPIGAAIYCASSQDVKRRYRHARPKPGQFRSRRVADVVVELIAEKLTANAHVARRNDLEADVEVAQTVAGPFQPAKDAAKMDAAVRGAFEKLGETRLALGTLKINNPAKLFVPVSQLNQLRRDLAEALEKKLDAAQLKRIEDVCAKELPPLPLLMKGGKMAAAFAWSVKVDRIAALDSFEASDWQDVGEVVVDVARDHLTLLCEKIEKLGAEIGRDKIRLALPAVTRKWEEKGLLLKIQKLRELGWNKWEAANVSSWSFLNIGLSGNATKSDTLSTDWSVYVMNRAAASQVLDMGAQRFALSPEDGTENMRSLLAEFGSQATVIVHQDTPWFMAESCAYANLIGGCPGKANCKFESMDMVSSYGEKVTAIDYHCRTIVLNKGAFCLSPRLKDLAAIGAKTLRADFIYRKYAPEETREIWRTLRAGHNVPGGYVANFDRGLK
jgi:putative protease